MLLQFYFSDFSNTSARELILFWEIGYTNNKII